MKKMLHKNVYEATNERLRYIFSKFDHVVVSFSGGKDSGLLLELVYQYYRKHNCNSQVSVYHIDYEGNYEQTSNYVKRSMHKYQEFSYYHICLPLSASSGVSMYHASWMPWDPACKKIWTSYPPKNAITLDNHEFSFFKIGMKDYDFQQKLSRWLHQRNKAQRTAILVGIRAQESLHRYHTVTRENTVTMFGTLKYSKRIYHNVFNFYPLYDWNVEDIWTAYGKFDWDYNHLYDLYYQAGIPLHDMRVANPFHHCGVHALKLYRAIEPNTWSKLLGRVNGANFAAIYGGTKAVGYKNISLPANHTWQTYVNFLLQSLPGKTRHIYLKKFNSSKNYWLKKGGGLSMKVVQELSKTKIEFEDLGLPNNKRQYKTEYRRVRFKIYPDDVNIKSFRSVPSYKRMCITILKNDTSCRYMGFSQTKDELQKQNEAIKQWKLKKV